jgi:hypothetical protein
MNEVSNTKEVRIDYGQLIDSIYLDVYSDAKFKKDLENVLDESVLRYGDTGRELPKYVDGWLDKPFMEGGKPTREKDLLVYNTILSGDVTLVEIEGGVRGGKDVIALFSWSRYLMVCPDKIHLALGSSLEHVLRTVLMSSGFGLFYTIPHGVFIRESVSGAQRGVYKFFDSYGIEKTVLFYGNDKENDSDKYQGFTLGSVYVNETLNQHIRGLDQGLNRISSASRPLMIMTQNPKGSSHEYYQKFEKPKLTTENNIKKLEHVRDTYKEAFEGVEAKVLDDMKKERIKRRKDFVASKGKSSYKFLSTDDQILLHEILLDVNYKYDKVIRDIPVEKFDPTIKEGDYLYGKSMKKVVAFFRGEQNVNHIQNAYNFAYFHYTIEDNMKVTKMQISDFKAQRGEGTATYEQEVMGLRRSTEGAVYTGFTNENIFDGDIKQFMWGNMLRFIVIDPGFNHPTGITDWAVDLDRGEAWCLQERLIDFNVEYTERKSLDVIFDEFLLILRNIKGRSYDSVFIDPSKPDLIDYFQTAGFNAYPANNRNWVQKRDEKEVSNEILSRELVGIPLVQTGFAKNKIHIHKDCVQLIGQIGSYSYKKTEDGKDKLQDLGDDLVVTVKYLMNTSGIVPAMWLNEEGGGLSEEGRVFPDGEKEISGEELARSFAEGLQGMAGFDQFNEEDYYGEDDFFGGTNDFFDY